MVLDPDLPMISHGGTLSVQLGETVFAFEVSSVEVRYSHDALATAEITAVSHGDPLTRTIPSTPQEPRRVPRQAPPEPQPEEPPKGRGIRLRGL